MSTKLVVDCITGIVQEVEMTASEIAALDQASAEETERQILEDAAKVEAEAAKEAGKAKLAALGLSDAEIAALVG
jgi:hypothetical protein